MKNKTILFQTKRLLIREFTLQDLDYIHEYAKQEEVVQFQNWGPNTIEDTQAFLQNALDWIDKTPRLTHELCIESKEHKIPIGGCGVFVEKNNAKEAKIGYILNPLYWNKGYVTEAVKGLIPYAKTRIGVEVIRATCDTKNFASKRVVEKTGFVLEEILHNHFELKGRMRDSFLFKLEG
ncbi:MAG: GNAT family N-acetyltransferase [Chitinophagales bacterium]